MPLDDALGEGLGAAGRDLSSLRGLFGATAREQRTNLAMAISGTTNKSSKEYRAARREVERIDAGTRRPGRRYRQAILRAGRSRIAAEQRGNRMKITIKGELGPAGGAVHNRDYKRRRTISTVLEADDMDEILDRWELGDDAGAAEIFEELFGEAYGADAGVPEWDLSDADSIGLEPL